MRLLQGKKVSMEEAICRSEKAFKPSNLKEHCLFWEEEILKDHPDKEVFLKWLSGVKIDHKNGYQHVPIHEDSRKFFRCFFGKLFYSVFAVLPFGRKSSLLVYHSFTEAVAMYCHLW